jgi:plasmid segregation protein ParM
MNIGIDIGYNATKVWSENMSVQFPSTVGTPDVSRFGLRGDREFTITIPGDGTWLFGDQAVQKSRTLQRREDRNWIESGEYYRLLMAAIAHAEFKSGDTINVVTGLPVSYFADAEKLKQILTAEHQFSANGETKTFQIIARIIPQPFGSLIDAAFDFDGKILDGKIVRGKIGVIDIGGKTTNILTVDNLQEVARKTTGVNVGGWEIVRHLREILKQSNQDLADELRDHDLANIIKTKVANFHGKEIDFSMAVDAAVNPVAEDIIAEAAQVWQSGATVDKIFITGGGAMLVGMKLKQRFSHAVIVDDPIFSNVRGYYKLAVIESKKEQ